MYIMIAVNSKQCSVALQRCGRDVRQWDRDKRVPTIASQPKLATTVERTTVPVREVQKSDGVEWWRSGERTVP